MNKIKDRLDQVLSKSQKEQIEFDAQMLAFQFLSIVDQAMEDQGVSKKELGAKIGKSPAFITQLFTGVRKPNWNILAKMQSALELEFKILEQGQVEEWMDDQLEEYRRIWSKPAKTNTKRQVTEVPNQDYAFAA